MDTLRTVQRKSFELNLKDFLAKTLQYKWLILVSVVFCLAMAYIYAKISIPTYEIGTTILIDASGSNRSLSKSQYLDGDVRLIETEKNIYNEMGILQSYGLIRQSLEELDYGICYKAGQWYKMEEYYGYFPFEVTPLDFETQAYALPFEVTLLSENRFQLTANKTIFYVNNPNEKGLRKVEKPLVFTETYNFGEEIHHPYFHFVINKPSYQLVAQDFENKKLQFEFVHIDDLTNAYLSKLEVNQTDIQASILQLKTQGTIVEKEIRFLEKLTDNYIFTSLLKRNEIARNKESFIRNQLGSISDSLERAETRMERFKRGTSSVNIEATLSSSMDKIDRIETDLNQVELNIKYYKQLLRYIKNSDNINKIIAPSAAGIDDPLLNENILELKNLYAEKTRKTFYKGEKSYDLEIIDQQIANTTRALSENVRNLIAASELAMKDKQGRIANLEQKLNRIPRSETQLGSHERKSHLYENLYNYLSQELAKTGIARAEKISDSRVIDAPRMLGNRPIAPQKKLIYVLGALFGLLLPLSWVVLTTSVNDKIQSAEYLEQVSSLPVAASIVHQRNLAWGGWRKGTSGLVEESFRDLSANLQFLQKGVRKNVIGLTSMINNEGKSFCATHLARSLATAGKRVLLIDTDFRSPSLMQPLSTDKKDLNQYILDKVAFAESIIYRHPEVALLDYIPARACNDNPHQLLSSNRLQTLLGELRYHYDFVLVDAPAVGLVSDYLLIAEHVDSHLFVLRHDYSKTTFLEDLMRLRIKGNMANAFLVYNDVPVRSYKRGMTAYGKQRERKQSFVARLFSF